MLSAESRLRPLRATGAIDILIFAIEAGRFGPARLPQNLESVGLRVGTLCSDDNVLAKTHHATRHYRLPSSRAAPQLARALADALAHSGAKLLIPADEQAVALLHSFMRGNCAYILGDAARGVIASSLAPQERLGAMLFKSETLALARSLGLRVPPGGTAANAAQAIALAEAVTYPVYVKHAFGWAGAGVTCCTDEAALLAAFPQSNPFVDRIKALARRVLYRDWYPAHSAIDVQGIISGRPAMYCALAWQGKLVGGFAGEALSTTSATGPSSEVRIGRHPGMARATKILVEALGCTGWIGFDFMLEEGTGEAVLLECNPRPIQVCHLGYRIGVDLAAELARLIRGGTPPAQPLIANRDMEVVLFPYAMDANRARPGALDDIPGKDPGLLQYGASLREAAALVPAGPAQNSNLQRRPRRGQLYPA